MPKPLCNTPPPVEMVPEPFESHYPLQLPDYQPEFVCSPSILSQKCLTMNTDIHLSFATQYINARLSTPCVLGCIPVDTES